MLHNNNLGFRGERIAELLLLEKGYSIIEKNFRCPYGEIDIVAKDKNTLVFVEVKTRNTMKFGYPEDSISQKKLNTIKNCGLYYVSKYNMVNSSLRIDIVSIYINKNKKIKVKIIKVF